MSVKSPWKLELSLNVTIPRQRFDRSRQFNFTKQQILDSSKLKEFADDNFKFDENGREFSKQVENTVGKEEIARYEQFLLFPQWFQKPCFSGALKGVIVSEWVKKKIEVRPGVHTSKLSLANFQH